MIADLELVTFKLDCGAEVTLRVWVDTANCRERDGRCMTAREIAGALWLALRESEASEGVRRPNTSL